MTPSDIYWQIKITEADQPYQFIIWHSDKTQPLLIYKLTTITYGLTSSPYLATRNINQLAIDEGTAYLEAFKVITYNIYIDDIVTGTSEITSVLNLQQQLILLLEKGQFQLCKWSSNTTEFLKTISKDNRETLLYFRSFDQLLFFILGLKWLPTTDEFSYTMEIPNPFSYKMLILLS